MGDKPHKKLEVWKKAVDITTIVYKITDKFPKAEIYGLTSQIQRAAVSIASNVAEGAARQTKKEFIQFLHCAQGSLSELDTQLIIANKLGYMTDDEFKIIEQELDLEDKMLTGLIKSIMSKIKK